jgi:hypothetical protein
MTTRKLTTATVSVADLREVVSVAIAKHPDQRSRIEKAAGIVLLRAIRPDAAFVACFDVESESEPGRFYSVDDGVGVCQCRDHRERGIVCKHLWALRLLAALSRLHTAAAAARVAAWRGKEDRRSHRPVSGPGVAAPPEPRCQGGRRRSPPRRVPV